MILRFLIFFWVVAFPSSHVFAQVTTAEETSLQKRLENRIDALIEQIDRMDNARRTRNLGVDEEVEKLRQRVIKIDEFSRVASDIREEIQRIENINTNFQAREDDFNDILSRLSIAEAQIIVAQQNALEAKNSASNIVVIVSIVSAIASILVILIGLFFSKRFMDLHAEARVAAEILKRIEARYNGD